DAVAVSRPLCGALAFAGLAVRRSRSELSLFAVQRVAVVHDMFSIWSDQLRLERKFVASLNDGHRLVHTWRQSFAVALVERPRAAEISLRRSDDYAQSHDHDDTDSCNDVFHVFLLYSFTTGLPSAVNDSTAPYFASDSRTLAPSPTATICKFAGSRYLRATRCTSSAVIAAMRCGYVSQ